MPFIGLVLIYYMGDNLFFLSHDFRFIDLKLILKVVNFGIIIIVITTFYVKFKVTIINLNN